MREVLKISATTNPNKAAGAIALYIKEQGEVEIQAVGAGAVNQAVKAIAIARTFVIVNGIDLVCVPNFRDIELNGEKKTAICLLVRMR